MPELPLQFSQYLLTGPARTHTQQLVFSGVGGSGRGYDFASPQQFCLCDSFLYSSSHVFAFVHRNSPLSLFTHTNLHSLCQLDCELDDWSEDAKLARGARARELQQQLLQQQEAMRRLAAEQQAALSAAAQAEMKARLAAEAAAASEAKVCALRYATLRCLELVILYCAFRYVFM